MVFAGNTAVLSDSAARGCPGAELERGKAAARSHLPATLRVMGQENGRPLCASISACALLRHHGQCDQMSAGFDPRFENPLIGDEGQLARRLLLRASGPPRPPKRISWLSWLDTGMTEGRESGGLR